VDLDGDGYGELGAVSPLDPGTDCDDGDAAVYPGAAILEEALCTVDLDGDGYGDLAALSPLDSGTDCDDGDASAYPGAAILEPSLCTVDLDGDGYGDSGALAPLDPGTDCDDTSSTLSPGIDDDGDGDSNCDDCDDANSLLNLTDVDGDGYSLCDGDCDDNDSGVNLDDWDGDGYTTCEGDCDDWDSSLNLDDADGDSYTTCDDDCDDSDASISPGVAEIAGDGIDQDCDGADLPLICYFKLRLTGGSAWCGGCQTCPPSLCNKVLSMFTGTAPLSQSVSGYASTVPYGYSSSVYWFSAQSGTRVELAYTGSGGGCATLEVHQSYGSSSGTILSSQCFNSGFQSGWFFYDDYPTCN